ncbi:MAG: AbiEi antitoxin N-terminal domain-containing protein, partial [Gammaproteobacteria bacterium]
MSDQNRTKINRLMEVLTDTTLVSSRWLRAHGYPGNLTTRYLASGWLQSPTRGVYGRKGGSVTWQGLLRTLQQLERLPLHVGGRFALAEAGFERDVRQDETGTMTLYGRGRLPGWATKLRLPVSVKHGGPGPFDWPASELGDEVSNAV